MIIQSSLRLQMKSDWGTGLQPMSSSGNKVQPQQMTGNILHLLIQWSNNYA